MFHKRKKTLSNVVVGNVSRWPSIKLPKHVLRNIVIVFVVFCLGIVALGLYVYYGTNYFKNIKYENIAKQSDAEGLKVAQDRTSKPIDSSANTEQKTGYYSSAMWLKIREGSQQDAVNYYINTVKPSGSDLNLDVNEALVPMLINTNHKDDAKKLAAKIVATYKSAPKTTDSLASQYIDKKVKYFSDLEKSL